MVLSPAKKLIQVHWFSGMGNCHNGKVYQPLWQLQKQREALRVCPTGSLVPYGGKPSFRTSPTSRRPAPCALDSPQLINVDKNAAYPLAIDELKAEETLTKTAELRPVKYLNKR